MNKKDADNEIKYRLAVMLLNDLVMHNKIDEKELLQYKKKLIRKYKPLIGRLEIMI